MSEVPSRPRPWGVNKSTSFHISDTKKARDLLLPYLMLVNTGINKALLLTEKTNTGQVSQNHNPPINHMGLKGDLYRWTTRGRGANDGRRGTHPMVVIGRPSAAALAPGIYIWGSSDAAAAPIVTAETRRHVVSSDSSVLFFFSSRRLRLQKNQDISGLYKRRYGRTDGRLRSAAVHFGGGGAGE